MVDAEIVDAGLLEQVPGVRVDGPTGRGFCGVATNSGEVRPGDLFVALVGVRDGHDFVPDAVARGAAGVLVSADVAVPADVTVARVPDTLRALQDLAALVRGARDVDAIAVTGSVGKTTVQNLLAHVLAPHGRVLNSPKSYNNHLGVPLTLLLLEPGHTDLVAEVGTNHPGEILPLARLVRPRAALVTGVGYAHLGNFDSREALADEKASIFAAVEPGGVWFVNADDALLAAAVDRLERPAATRVVTFGRAADADVRVSDVEVGDDGTRGVLHVDGDAVPFSFPLVGPHFGAVAACVVAVAVERGIAAADAVARFATFAASPGRAAVTVVRDGAVRIVDDSYNGSPDSMMGALDALAAAGGPGRRRVAVLGEMRELGRWSEALHRDLGDRAAATVDDLVFIGDSEPVVRAAAVDAGLAPQRIRAASSATEAGAIVQALLDGAADAAVLVKGSRFVHTERVPLILEGVPVACTRAVCELYIHCRTCPLLLTGDAATDAADG